MKYYFKDGSGDVYIKAETLQEIELLKKKPFIYIKKATNEFFTIFRYLIDLNKTHGIEPYEPSDKEIAKKLFNRIKYLNSISRRKSINTNIDYKSFIDPESGLVPKNFQIIGAEYIVKAKRCILADDVGLGKTIQSILGVCGLIEKGVIKKKIIIITPASIKYQWKNEILERVNLKRFPQLADICIVEGTKKERSKMYESDSFVFIVNYEQFIHDYVKLDFLCEDVDAVILDEASKIKNPSAKRSRNIKACLHHAKVKILITATPIENSLLDLYSLCNFLDKKIFTSYTHFKETYCKFIEFRLGKNGGGSRFRPKITKLVGYKNLDDAKIKIMGMYIRRTVDMVGVQLPKFIVQLRYTEMLPEQKRMYNDIKNDPYKTDLAKISALKMIANAPEAFSPTKLAKSSKIKELMYLLENEITTEKVIIFCFHKTVTDILYNKLKVYNPLYIHGQTTPKDREKYRQMFNTMSKYRVIIMTGAGEFGIDLPSASVLVNMDLPDNPSRLKQRCGRNRRLSSEYKNIRVINILAKDTIEEKTIKRIFRKMDLFTEFFNDDNPDLISGGSFYSAMSKKDLSNIM